MQTPIRSRQSRRTGSLLKGFALALPLALPATYLAIGAVAANALTVPKRQYDAQNTPSRLNLAFDEVHFPSRGGEVRIAGWYIPRGDSGRALLLVHGRDSSRTVEFAGRFVELAAALHGCGYHVLMIDLRGHGRSGGGRYSFGLKERRDVQGAVDWLLSKGFMPGSIGVLGVSLGAASAIGAMAEEPRIGALVTDSAFADFTPVLQAHWRVDTGLPVLLQPSALLMTRVLFGIDLRASRPYQEVSRIPPRPLFLIHSAADALVPVSNVERLAAAAPSAETWVVSGSEHARIYNDHSAEYVERVSRFFDKSLGRGGVSARRVSP